MEPDAGRPGAELERNELEMRYEYFCPSCRHTEEIICSMSEHKSSIRCPKCKKMIPQVISGGTHRFVHGATLGGLIDSNTDRMSLDEKIKHGTQKYQTLNPKIKPELAERDRKNKIEKEIKEITKAHNS
jgi:putative FmdB family regulatory protein